AAPRPAASRRSARRRPRGRPGGARAAPPARPAHPSRRACVPGAGERSAAREGAGGARGLLLAALSRRRGRARGERAPAGARRTRDGAARRPRRAAARTCARAPPRGGARGGLLAGVPGATTLAEAALTNPAALLARLAEGVTRQVLYDATALGPLLVIPFVLGFGTARGTRGPFAVAAWFTALPLALNPSPRYAVPLVPLLLPAAAAGLLALGERLGRHARLAMAALGVALVVQALWVSHPLDAACSREVSRLVLERYGPGQALVAVDGRFAYGAHGRALVPPTTDPEDA